jgi:UDP-N-acetylglucosamine--N-acetylmuramyl-(pentapeptide) pyrophosphoryl-undecaprenol N-acetylglucosamine transferase
VPEGWGVLWATGTKTYENFRALDGPRIRVVNYLSPIADAYAVADLALVRGGMMGTAELCAWGVPMLVVPLPTAAADHQTWNARSLEAAGAAVHLPQRELTPAKLNAVFSALINDPARLASLTEGALRRAKPNAAADIATRISALVPE